MHPVGVSAGHPTGRVALPEMRRFGYSHRLAIDQGVPVFATPGDVDRVVSMGTNRLIRDGAFPVFDADDLSQVLDLIVPFAAVGDPAIDR